MEICGNSIIWNKWFWIQVQQESVENEYKVAKIYLENGIQWWFYWKKNEFA